MDTKKFLVSLVATVLVGLQTGLSDGVLSLLDWLAIVSAGLGAISVWLAPNISVSPYIKTGIQFVFGLVTIASTFLGDGVFSSSDVITTIIMALATIGVYAVPGPLHVTNDVRV